MFRRGKSDSSLKAGDSGVKYRSSLTGKGAKYSLGGSESKHAHKALYTSTGREKLQAEEKSESKPSGLASSLKSHANQVQTITVEAANRSKSLSPGDTQSEHSLPDHVLEEQDLERSSLGDAVDNEEVSAGADEGVSGATAGASSAREAFSEKEHHTSALFSSSLDADEAESGFGSVTGDETLQEHDHVEVLYQCILTECLCWQ